MFRNPYMPNLKKLSVKAVPHHAYAKQGTKPYTHTCAFVNLKLHVQLKKAYQLEKEPIRYIIY